MRPHGKASLAAAADRADEIAEIKDVIESRVRLNQIGVHRLGSARQRPYTETELELFARYREKRASVRPEACEGGAGCWVQDGPPAMIRSEIAGRKTSCRLCGAQIGPA